MCNGQTVDDADRDEEFAEQLKSQKAESARRAGIAKSRSGRRADKPTYVDPRVLDRDVVVEHW